MNEEGNRGPSEAGIDRSALVRAVATTIRCPVTGALAARVAAIADAHPPDRERELLLLARSLRGYRTASGAVAALESLAAGVTSSAPDAPADPRARLETVRRLIATLEQLDPGSEQLAALQAERASLSAVTGEA